MIPAATTPIYWHLPLLIVIISLVYSATRFDDWHAIIRDAVRWAVRVGGFLLAIGLALYAVATFLL
jgi:hypothetical protein